LNRKPKNIKKVPFPGTSVAYSCDSKTIALGCDNGYVIIMETMNNNIMKTLKDRKHAITCLKFSSDDEFLAVGGFDTEIICYSVLQGFKFLSRVRAHTEPIIALDFSKDGNYIQSVSKGGKLLYSQTKDRKIVGKGKMNRDVKWDTWTLPVGWPVTGIWKGCYKNGDINCLDSSPEHSLCAIGDNFGRIKLFEYPCSKFNASYNTSIGHSSKVSNLKFSKNGDYLYSVGGNDKSVLQWRVINNKVDNEYQDELDNDKEMEQINKGLDELMLENADPEKMAYAIDIIDNYNQDDNKDKQFLDEVRMAIPDEYKSYGK